MAFPGEAYLQEVPPNYEWERMVTGVLVVVSFFVCAVVIPTAMVTKVEPEAPPEKLKAETNKKAKGRTKNKSSEEPAAAAAEEVVYQVNPLVTVFSTALTFVVVLGIMLRVSPDNYYSPRGVFQAPVLTRAECNELLEMAERAAEQNYKEARSMQGMYALVDNPASEEALNGTMKGLLEYPEGWQKLRHSIYPTTDLNVVTDPFTKEDRAYIRQKLDARLSPMISRVFGIPRSAIRANDMFFVRYDHDRRAHLAIHTDDSDISFNVLLTDDFEGGGTRFWNRITERVFTWVTPTQVGQGLVHSALLQHEGMQVTNGTRIILVGFLSVDKVDPWTGKSTGLSWFSSWGSLAWSTVKFKEGLIASGFRAKAEQQATWWDNTIVRNLFNDLHTVLTLSADFLNSHFAVNLVPNKNRKAYLAALDRDYQERGTGEGGRSNGEAEWFAGQQIDVDITGAVNSIWTTRRHQQHRFMESEL